MDFNEYQSKTSETAKTNIKGDVFYLTLGLCGEAGEVADKIKKNIRDGELDINSLALELGDVMWYIAQLCEAYKLNMNDVAEMNIEKLRGRKSRDKIGGSGDVR